MKPKSQSSLSVRVGGMNLLALALAALPLSALAQDQAAPTPPEPQSDVARLEARIAELEKQAQAKPAEAKPAEAKPAEAKPAGGLKLSGYLQGRYEWRDDADYGLSPTSDQPLGTTRFLVRRARLKALHQGKNSEYLLQLSGSNDELTFVDAEASLVDTWTPLNLKLTMGQFKVPFGFELQYSSSEREAPERSRMFGSFYPGERDRGVRLTGKYSFLNFTLAVINGNGVRDAIYRSYDQTSFKDIVGRVQADWKFLAFGVSTHFGHTLKTKPDGAAGTAKGMRTYERFERLRMGADAQGKINIAPLGDLILRAEAIMAKDKAIEFSQIAGDPCSDVTSFGWYGQVIQYFGSKLGLSVRLDQFDPNSGVGAACKAFAGSETDRVTTIGTAVFSNFTENIRLTLAYDHITEQTGAEKGNDLFIAQIQTKF